MIEIVHAGGEPSRRARPDSGRHGGYLTPRARSSRSSPYDGQSSATLVTIVLAGRDPDSDLGR